MEQVTYRVCEDCGKALESGEEPDWMCRDEKDADRIESGRGMLAHLDSAELTAHYFGGYYRCSVCEYVHIASGYLATTQERP